MVGGPAVLSSDGGTPSSSSAGVAAKGEGVGLEAEAEAEVFGVPDEVEPDGLASEAGIEALRATVLLIVGLNFLLFAVMLAQYLPCSNKRT
jgi:hypothetical protein